MPYEVYQAQDAYLTLGVANNSLYERFCAAIGRPDLTKDARFDTEAKRVANRDTLNPLLNDELGKRPTAEWLTRLDKAGVPAGKIKTVAEVCESPHLKARGMVVSLPHPKAGVVTMMGVPIRLWETPGAALVAPPLLGQHTDEILTRLLRYPEIPRDQAPRRRRHLAAESASSSRSVDSQLRRLPARNLTLLEGFPMMSGP